MYLDAAMHARIREDRAGLRASRLVEGHVSHQSLAEEGGNAQLGAVKKLVGDQKLSRLQILLQRTHGTYGNDALDAKLLHGVHVGAEIDLAGQDAVSAAMAREEGHTLPFQHAEHDGIRRLAEGSLHANLARVGQASHGI